MIETEISFPRGTCPIRLFGEIENADHPMVLFFMDGFGPRATLYTMAERLAGEGYRVVLPHLFYEHLPDASISVAGVLGGDTQVLGRLNSMLAGLDQAAVDADIGALLAFCHSLPGPDTTMGATGYCMGGRYAITAATLSPRLRFAASFHGATLAPENGDSAHRRLAGVKASVYVGIAEFDPMFDADEEGRLAAALRAAGVDHSLETYAGAAHGFTMSDLPIYNEAAAERHWRRLFERLRDQLG